MKKNYTLSIRYMPAVYGTKTIDGSLTKQEALTKAAEFCQNKFKACLTTPDGKNFWLDVKGTHWHTTQDTPPTMTINGSSFQLDVE